MPEAPTTAEAGLPGVDAQTWYGIVAAAGPPRPIVARLNREFMTMLNSAELKKQLLHLGAEARPQTPEEFLGIHASRSGALGESDQGRERQA